MGHGQCYKENFRLWKIIIFLLQKEAPVLDIIHLFSDMRSLPIMAKNGYPVIFDATHSIQQPGGQGDKSGGQREFVEHLSRAAVAVGVAGIFMETHQDPDSAPSDGPNMIPLSNLENLLKQLIAIDNIVKNN